MLLIFLNSKSLYYFDLSTKNASGSIDLSSKWSATGAIRTVGMGSDGFGWQIAANVLNANSSKLLNPKVDMRKAGAEIGRL